jgi:hypothetical protein
MTRLKNNAKIWSGTFPQSSEQYTRRKDMIRDLDKHLYAWGYVWFVDSVIRNRRTKDYIKTCVLKAKQMKIFF